MMKATDYKQGDSFKAKVPFGRKPYKIHISYVLPSKAYEGRKLIIYKIYGRHKQWWHEFMCTTDKMDSYIEIAKQFEINKNLI